MIKGQHTHLYDNKKIFITSKGWNYILAKTTLATHCMNKSNEKMKTRHTYVLEKLIVKYLPSYISTIPIFVLPLKFLYSCAHWNTDHVTLMSHPVSVTMLTNCSMCCGIVASVCFPSLTLSQSCILLSPHSYIGLLPNITTNHLKIKI